MSPVSITKEANEYLSNTIDEHKALGVQLSIEGGGCAGFYYKWEFVNSEVKDVNSDEIIKLDKGLLYIHPTAIMYVLGTIIDFTKDVAGSYLQINNPNATSQCGCGESFSYG